MSREPVLVSGVRESILKNVDTELKDARIWSNENESESSKYVFHVHKQEPT